VRLIETRSYLDEHGWTGRVEELGRMVDLFRVGWRDALPPATRALAAYAFSFSAKALRNFSSLGAMMNRQYGWLTFSLK